MHQTTLRKCYNPPCLEEGLQSSQMAIGLS
jgi:hypothetical protein